MEYICLTGSKLHYFQLNLKLKYVSLANVIHLAAFPSCF